MDTPKALDFADYSMRLFHVSPDYGGGWAASAPELAGCSGVGDTAIEALYDLQEAIEGWLDVNKDLGRPIPAPKMWVPEEYSGKLTARLPKSLHRELAETAEREGVSMNQMLVCLLSGGLVHMSRGDHAAAAEEDGMKASPVRKPSVTMSQTTASFTLTSDPMDTLNPDALLNALIERPTPVAYHNPRFARVIGGGRSGV